MILVFLKRSCFELPQNRMKGTNIVKGRGFYQNKKKNASIYISIDLSVMVAVGLGILLLNVKARFEAITDF